MTIAAVLWAAMAGTPSGAVTGPAGGPRAFSPFLHGGNTGLGLSNPVSRLAAERVSEQARGSVTGRFAGGYALTPGRQSGQAMEQVSGQAPGDVTPLYRTVENPVPPMTAMLHSLALPGWGQFDNERPRKGALLIATESTFIAGFLYYNYRVQTGDDLSEWDVSQLQNDRNTFVIYWFLAKVFGMMDAYVDAQLATFDVEDITPPPLRGGTPETRSPSQ